MILNGVDIALQKKRKTIDRKRKQLPCPTLVISIRNQGRVLVVASLRIAWTAEMRLHEGERIRAAKREGVTLQTSK